MTLKHPLDPLESQEIEKAVELLKSDKRFKEGSTFISAILDEPDKSIVSDYKENDPIPRKVKLLGSDKNPDGGFCAKIDIVKNQVVSYERLKANGQAPYNMEEMMTAIGLTIQNPEYQKALKKRGITDFELLHIDPWPAGGFVHETIKPGHRALKCISFLKESMNDNGYAKPIQGVISWVDVTLGKVVHVEDHGVVPIPKEHARYDIESQPKIREG